MCLKPGKTGLGGPDDFELKTGYDDDGEQWAGIKYDCVLFSYQSLSPSFLSRILKTMEAQAVLDAVVVCSRWYSRVLLSLVAERRSKAETGMVVSCSALYGSPTLKPAPPRCVGYSRISKSLKNV
jgi:hypothetical protein